VSVQARFAGRLRRYYLWFTVGLIVFLIALGFLERAGLPRPWIGYIFIFAIIAMYASIGVMARTTDVVEYYVAGRRVPAGFNGMATGADWMSAASFISMAGGLYVQGFDGLAFVMGWTGGFCLVAFLLAPYLRKFGQFTIPDFLGMRYGNLARSIGIFAAIMVSFTYVVAQIFGVGLVTARFLSTSFEIGVFVGLAGILVCSFLGGMRAVTWTQVAQYIVLIVAYLLPVVWLSIKHTGSPVPQLSYGWVLEKVTAREQALIDDPGEIAVRKVFAQQAADLRARLNGLPASWEQGRRDAEQKLLALKEERAPRSDILAAERAVRGYPTSPEQARAKWTVAAAQAQARAGPLSGLPRHATPFPGDTEAARTLAQRNFITLVFCLMLGTAALPHILVRFYTTPSVHETRMSVFWTVLCIFVLYASAPALAVLVKYDIFTQLVGSRYADLPAWAAAWSKVRDLTGPMLSIIDVNGDGIVQLGEITISQDIVVLATPEIAGLPYVVSGLVAAGGLSAALSTADGLLLTIANALSHDLYYKMVDPTAARQERVTISKIIVLLVALMAAWVTSRGPGNILFLVGAAFSLAASALFPALVLGIFWSRANRPGAVAGMLAGLLLCTYYMMSRYGNFQQLFGLAPENYPLWFGIAPISAGVFGVPFGLVVTVFTSLATAAPDSSIRDFVRQLRHP
jgi:cation/acetate symporter